MPALQLTWLACFTAMVATLVFAPQLISEVAVAPLPKIGWLVYLGLAPTALGFTTWAYALSHTPAGRLGVTTYLIPPVVIGLAWLLLGEVPPLLAIVGGASCLAGVIIVRNPSLLLPSPLRAKPPERIAPS